MSPPGSPSSDSRDSSPRLVGGTGPSMDLFASPALSRAGDGAEDGALSPAQDGARGLGISPPARRGALGGVASSVSRAGEVQNAFSSLSLGGVRGSLSSRGVDLFAGSSPSLGSVSPTCLSHKAAPALGPIPAAVPASASSFPSSSSSPTAIARDPSPHGVLHPLRAFSPPPNPLRAFSPTPPPTSSALAPASVARAPLVARIGPSSRASLRASPGDVGASAPPGASAFPGPLHASTSLHHSDGSGSSMGSRGSRSKAGLGALSEAGRSSTSLQTSPFVVEVYCGASKQLLRAPSISDAPRPSASRVREVHGRSGLLAAAAPGADRKSVEPRDDGVLNAKGALHICFDGLVVDAATETAAAGPEPSKAASATLQAATPADGLSPSPPRALSLPLSGDVPCRAPSTSPSARRLDGSQQRAAATAVSSPRSPSSPFAPGAASSGAASSGAASPERHLPGAPTESAAPLGAASPRRSRHLWLGNVVRRPSDKMLAATFRRFGAVESARVFPLKSYAFVNFVEPSAAARAADAMSGVVLPQITGSKALVIRYQHGTACGPGESPNDDRADAAAGRAAGVNVSGAGSDNEAGPSPGAGGSASRSTPSRAVAQRAAAASAAAAAAAAQRAAREELLARAVAAVTAMQMAPRSRQGPWEGLVGAGARATPSPSPLVPPPLPSAGLHVGGSAAGLPHPHAATAAMAMAHQRDSTQFPHQQRALGAHQHDSAVAERLQQHQQQQQHPHQQKHRHQQSQQHHAQQRSGDAAAQMALAAVQMAQLQRQLPASLPSQASHLSQLAVLAQQQLQQQQQLQMQMQQLAMSSQWSGAQSLTPSQLAALQAALLSATQGGAQRRASGEPGLGDAGLVASPQARADVSTGVHGLAFKAVPSGSHLVPSLTPPTAASSGGSGVAMPDASSDGVAALFPPGVGFADTFAALCSSLDPAAAAAAAAAAAPLSRGTAIDAAPAPVSASMSASMSASLARSSGAVSMLSSDGGSGGLPSLPPPASSSGPDIEASLAARGSLGVDAQLTSLCQPIERLASRLGLRSAVGPGSTPGAADPVAYDLSAALGARPGPGTCDDVPAVAAWTAQTLESGLLVAPDWASNALPAARWASAAAQDASPTRAAAPAWAAWGPPPPTAVQGLHVADDPRQGAASQEASPDAIAAALRSLLGDRPSHAH